MTDDVAHNTPTAESTPTLEPAAPVAPPESTQSTMEPSPVAEQVEPAEPASVIPKESQSAPEPTSEPPEIEVSAPEPKPATQSASSQPPQRPPAAQSSQSVPSTKWSAINRTNAIAKRVGRKEARLAKVVDLAKEKGRITNDDIEKLLHISDATAARYGTTLMQRDLLKREGKGRGVSYVPSV